VLRTRQIVQNPVTGEQLQVIQTGDETDGRLLVIDFFLAPNKGQVSLAHRQDTEESWTVVEGSAAYMLEGKVQPPKSGEALVVPRGAAHMNPGTHPTERCTCGARFALTSPTWRGCAPS
jgi:mannose-6-phosphate isomerase-like protein (cupin superfamily)